jgi:hypothetical protein
VRGLKLRTVELLELKGPANGTLCARYLYILLALLELLVLLALLVLLSASSVELVIHCTCLFVASLVLHQVPNS